MQKEFSVLMSVYKSENSEWFREALDSVFAQTVQPNEVVLVEDGPLTPELYSVIDEYSSRHPIFNIVKNETNLGLGLALQKGVQACSCEIIARMDTDDYIPPTRFEKELSAIENGYDVVSTLASIYHDDFKEENLISIRNFPEHNDDLYKLAKRKSPICHAAAMYRKSSVLKAGNYLHCQFYEDYYLWVRMMLNKASFYVVQEPLYYVRTYGATIARRGGFKYLKNEICNFWLFHRIGFYSFSDFAINSMIRIFGRLAPTSLRTKLLKFWNK